MAGALNRVPEDAESAAPPSSVTESGLPLAAPRPVPARPRPVSMPPQPFHPASDPDSRPAANPGDPPSHRKHRDSAHTSSSRSGRSNRILGDYTVGKTLGAGSMGKVKLAVHNVSGEKVRRILLLNSFRFPAHRHLARHQGPPQSQPSTSPSRPRISKTGLQGRLQGNPHPPRGCPLLAAPPPLHLWHAGNDYPSAPLLHGL